jgi:hypothetical protein
MFFGVLVWPGEVAVAGEGVSRAGVSMSGVDIGF